MNSIRKLKKVLKRYPIMIEVHVSATYSREAINDFFRHLKNKFGDNVLIFIFPIEKPQLIIDKIEMTPEQLADFKSKWDEHSRSPRSPYVRPYEVVENSNPDIFIHSICQLTPHQHKELKQIVNEQIRLLSSQV